MIKTKIVSSLEKALVEDNIDSFGEVKKISALKGERVSVQLLHTYIHEPNMGHGDARKIYAYISTSGDLAKYTVLSDVANVGVERPTLEGSGNDDNYISKRPGLFPDVLRPIHNTNQLCVTNSILLSVWVEISLPKKIRAGKHKLTLTLTTCSELISAENEIEIEVIDAVMPEESIYMTQWFHCDCLATYYNVKTWSKRHWQIIESFARTAVKNGINMLLTPTFTPPLDTAIGGERPTTQLVGVTKCAGEYSFDFTLLDKWIKMCDKVGIKYLEIAHFFTQWGAEHAPKVMATVDGEYKKIFGWETSATGEEYRTFLRAFLTAFLTHMRERGDDKRCFFHISDEPSADHLENYRAAKAQIADLLDGYTVMDALSKYDFWQMGVVKTPIPANNHIAPFIEAKVPNLWTYYCCSQSKNVSNRFIAMPSARNRSIGYQMYKYDIVGFLQWGYNFYYSYLSTDLINPFIHQDGDAWVSAGDAYSVYPAQDGTAWESIRIKVFFEALQDLKVMRLCEKYCGKEAIVKIIDEVIGKDVTFDDCARHSSQILEIRERVNALLKAAL